MIHHIRPPQSQRLDGNRSQIISPEIKISIKYSTRFIQFFSCGRLQPTPHSTQNLCKKSLTSRPSELQRQAPRVRLSPKACSKLRGRLTFQRSEPETQRQREARTPKSSEGVRAGFLHNLCYSLSGFARFMR